MTKCKKKNCNNTAIKEKEYCKYHQSKKEESVKDIFGLGISLALIVVTLDKKFRK